MWVSAVVFLLPADAPAADSTSGHWGAKLSPVLTPRDGAVAPGDQMRAFLVGETDAAWVRWNEAYERRRGPGAIREHEQALREKFIAALGGFPARTPLNARITGRLQREGYLVEKVIFESQPRFFVTAALFLPDPARFAPPYPGVLVPCGHYRPAKAHDEYQAMGALLALNGMAALVFDPIDQGERIQNLDASGRARYWGTSAHTLADIQAMPLGQGIARYFIWDAMRAIDYLQERPEIDPDRIGVTGNSGGATQASQLFALDERVQVAAPSCYVHHVAAQLRHSVGDGEQYVFGQLAFGLDHPDLLLMRAPAPVKLLAATHDFFPIEATWETFRLVQRAYTRFGASERAAILENDAGHNYNRTQREGAARWLARWLQGRDIVIEEPPLQLFSESELQCTPRGQVLLLPETRSIVDLLREGAENAETVRDQRWRNLPPEDRLTAVRQTAGFRPLDTLPRDTWTTAWELIEPGLRLEAWRVRTADGALEIPALWIQPDTPSDEPAGIFLSATGFQAAADPGGPLDQLVRSGRRILALDVRGTGETRQTEQSGMTAAVGRDYWDIYAAFVLGRSYVGMQAEDVLSAVREVKRRTGEAKVDLWANGGVGVPALHAAYAEREHFRHVQFEGTLASWDALVRADRTYDQLMNVVYGALQTYDLPDLAAELESALTVLNPASPLGLPLDDDHPPTAADQVPSEAGLVGIYYGSPEFMNPQVVEEFPDSHATWHTLREQRGRDWSAAWSGFLVPDASGPITLAIAANERATLAIAGDVVAEANEESPRATATITFAAGEALPCEIRFDQRRRESNPPDYTSFLRVSWRDPAGEWQPLPASWLRHSRQQARAAERGLR